MTYFLKDIDDFHAKFGIKYEGPPRVLPRDLAAFRLRFLAEELRELGHSLGFDVHTTVTIKYSAPPPTHHNLNDTLDALVDLNYVLLGTTQLSGLSQVFPHAWSRVHEANMKKMRATPTTQGKRSWQFDVVKPMGWQPPTFSDLLETPQ